MKLLQMKSVGILLCLLNFPAFSTEWYGMGVEYDCYGGPTSDAETNNTVSLKFYDQNGNAVYGSIETSPDDCDEGGWPFTTAKIHGATQHRASVTPITEVEISTDGYDAHWIDYVKLIGYSYASNEAASPITGMTFIYQVGSNNDQGWALSTDPNDYQGWTPYLPTLVAKSCWRFKKGSNFAYNCY